VAYGSRCIGIILSGYLDDGTAGLLAIKRCGGICVVQDPLDAEYPDMPRNALNQIQVDLCVPLNKMGGDLVQLVQEKKPARKKIPLDIVKEAKIAEQVLSDLESVNSLGVQVPFNCPQCGGVLWKMSAGNFTRYRCHTGHSFTGAVLVAEQTRKIEETMWVALRMFEERRNLLTTLSHKDRGLMSRSAKERAMASQVHIDRIRSILLSDDKPSESDLPK
jgi:two-component system chemotaxis response regulator CheB